MEERTRNIVVGITTLAGLAGLLALLLLFGYLPAWFKEGYHVTVELPQAGGLNTSNRVYLSGIDIGEVESVSLRPPPQKGVIAVARIRSDVRIPQNARVVVESSSLLGGSAIVAFQVDGVDGQVEQYLPTDGSAVVQGQVPSLMDLGDTIQQLSQEWKQVGQHLNRLLEPRSPDAVDTGQTAANLSTVLQRVDARMAEMKEVIAGIQAYTNDEQLRQDIRAAAAGSRQLIDELSTSAQELRQTLGQSVQSLRDRYVALADDLSHTAATIQRLVAAAEQPDGTLGKMINDPSLYNNLNDTFQRMQQAIDEMRLLIQKWKAEGVPIQF
ncbi:MAG TPA: MlaD family protein [Phycisphaeraceae bacterium]